MNGSVRQSAARNPRRHAIPQVSPITRAIRSVLTVSATVLALSVGTIAHAGTCRPDTTAGIAACHGAWAAEAQEIAPADLTRVEASDHPRSVHALSSPGDIAAMAAIDITNAVTGWDDGADWMADAGGASATAQALAYYAEAEVEVVNDGLIEATDSTVYDMAVAVGMYASAYEVATLLNYGDVLVSADSVQGDAVAYGMFGYAGASGIGLAINGGTVAVESSAGAGAQAHATGINVVADVASVFNDGSSSAVASAGDGGLADARAARAYGMYVAVYNYGDLVASADAAGGVASARGADSLGILGSTVYNAGDITASASANGGVAAAFGSYSVGVRYSAYTTNNGTISADASGDSASAYGSLNVSALFGNAVTTNAGSISAVAEGGVAPYGEAEAIAFGVYNSALLYDSVVDNSGSISATALAMADISGTYGFLQAKAIGAEALGAYGYGDTVVANSGDIDAVAMSSQGYASAWGAVVLTTGLYGGTAIIDNGGSISAYAYADIGVGNAIGAYVLNQRSTISAVNHGDIVATADVNSGIPYVSVNYAYATGLKAASYYGTTGVYNYGDITALAHGEGAIVGARGIQAGGATIAISNAEGATISATGEVDVFGGGFATGIEANGIYAIDIVNDGDIDVYGHAHAYSTHYGASRAMGIYAAAGMQGNVAVANNGSINATALSENSLSFFQGGAGATGINAYAKYDASIVNNGDISASAQSEFGITAAYGVIGHGKYTTNVVNAGGASIVAEASVGTLVGDNYGGRAFTAGIHVFGNGMEQGTIYNAGSIVAHATVTAEAASLNRSMANARGASIGAYSNVLNGTVVNLGDIEAAASADFGYATAYGSYVVTGFGSEISNAGSIQSSATAIDGNAFAVGAHAFSRHETRSYNCYYKDGPYGQYYFCDWANPVITLDGGESLIDNSGSILAMASAEGGLGYSYGAAVFGALSASITNSGSIRAITDADAAKATGALVNGMYGDASLTNSGDILASATGSTSAVATGAWVRAANGAQVVNSGRILAGAYGTDAIATGVQMGDAGSNVLVNSGTIGAFGDGERIAVWSGLNASASISNSGSLTGAVVTGDLDDSLVNAASGRWLALGDSDFGSGDDAIVNHGGIWMQDANIALGGYVQGNAFDNFGTLFVSGSNDIDMGGGFALRNTGTINFVDGAADDSLSLDGNMSGSGNLYMDLNPSNGTADQLRVNGSVAANAVQTVNVVFPGMPISAHTSVAFAHVSGTSTAGNFVAGQMIGYNHAANFLDLGLTVSSQINAANTANDVFSINVDVNGLNDTGALAASASSGAAVFLNSQVGTFRQRLGFNPYGDAGKVMSAFARYYTSNGDLRQAHTAANFGQGGNFNFDQSSWGTEVGVNANLFGNFHAGLVLGQADSRQRLIDGYGTSRMDGKTVGGYATWYAPGGLYVDLSTRQMAMDIFATSAAGVLQSRAHAKAHSIEAGYEVEIGGFNLVPQLQYTRTEVEGIRDFIGNRANFESHGGTFSRTRLGLEFNKTMDINGVRWTPYGSVNAIRESDGASTYTVATNFHGTTSLKGSSGMAEIGLSVEKGGFGFNLGANWTDGGAFKSTVGGQAVVRFSW